MTTLTLFTEPSPPCAVCVHCDRRVVLESGPHAPRAGIEIACVLSRQGFTVIGNKCAAYQRESRHG